MRPQANNIAFLFLLFISFIGFLSCSDTEFSGALGKISSSKSADDNEANEDNEDNDDSNEIFGSHQNEKDDPEIMIGEDESVIGFCGSNAMKTFETTLIFPADNIVCSWGAEGNLAAGSGIQASQSYIKTIDIGEEVASLCSFEISMAKEFTQYDDDITFTFDNYAFAGDYFSRGWLKTTVGLTEENGLLVFDRAKIIGKAFPPEQSWLEEGVEGEFNTRQNAATQREGNFNLSLGMDFFDRFLKEKLTKSKHDFGFHISGSKHATDCQHDGFNFDIKVTYVKK